MYRRLYKARTCRHCGKEFVPLYANQHVHPKCRGAWRKGYLRAYHRKYQRKVRWELKRDWEEFSAQGS